MNQELRQRLLRLATRKGALSIALPVLAFLLLQVSFSVFFWLPIRNVGAALRPSVDVLAIVALIVAGTAAHQLRGGVRKAVVIAVPVVLGACVLLGVAQGVALREFGYNFTLAYHTSKVQALFKMMYEAQSWPVFTISMMLLGGAIALLIGSAAWALSRLIRDCAHSSGRRITVALCVLLYSLPMGVVLGTNRSMVAELASQLDEVVHREERIREGARKLEKKLRTVKRFKRGENLRRPTVLVFVVESYGQVLMEAEKYADFRGFLREQEGALASAGYAMHSKVYKAPVFGGSSWLANATILCRVVVGTEKDYFSLMETEGSCVPSVFNEAGYHSVFAASNTTHIDDDYRKKFPFETFFTKDDFGYEGPRMSWSYMPDQFLIQHVEEEVLKTPSERPYFAYYKLTSSHHPWDTIPPYIEDWGRIGKGALYNKVKGVRFPDNAFLGGKHYNEGYEAAVRYSLKTIVNYLSAMPEDRDVLAVILGDHQPRRPVAVMDKDPWTVPYHVLSRDAALIDRFKRVGFHSGLFTPAPPEEAPGLETIIEDLVRSLNDVTFVEETVEQ